MGVLTRSEEKILGVKCEPHVPSIKAPKKDTVIREEPRMTVVRASLPAASVSREKGFCCRFVDLSRWGRPGRRPADDHSSAASPVRIRKWRDDGHVDLTLEVHTNNRKSLGICLCLSISFSSTFANWSNCLPCPHLSLKSALYFTVCLISEAGLCFVESRFARWMDNFLGKCGFVS